MKRRIHIAELQDAKGKTLAMSPDKYTWNSGIAAAVDLVRQYARERGEVFEAGPVAVENCAGVGRQYQQVWTSATTDVRVLMNEVY